MGKEVLKTSHNGSPYLRAYSHCSRQQRVSICFTLSNSSPFINFYFFKLLVYRFFICRHGEVLKYWFKTVFFQPGVTLLLINLSNSTFFDVAIAEDSKAHRKLFETRSQREEYHLTAKDGDIQSDVVLLNGSPLQLTNSSDIIPQMQPVLVDSSSAIRVAPHSFVFVVLKDIKARACA